MKFIIQWEEGDLVAEYDDHGNLLRTGVVISTDYWSIDHQWVAVAWDDAHPNTDPWMGRGLTLKPKIELPVPPKFKSIEEANAWLEEHS